MEFSKECCQLGLRVIDEVFESGHFSPELTETLNQIDFYDQLCNLLRIHPVTNAADLLDQMKNVFDENHVLLVMDENVQASKR
jgi:hypothetical protein